MRQCRTGNLERFKATSNVATVPPFGLAFKAVHYRERGEIYNVLRTTNSIGFRAHKAKKDCFQSSFFVRHTANKSMFAEHRNNHFHHHVSMQRNAD